MAFVFLFSRWLCLPLHYTRVLSTWGRYHFAVLLKSSEPATTGNTPRSVEPSLFLVQSFPAWIWKHSREASVLDDPLAHPRRREETPGRNRGFLPVRSTDPLLATYGGREGVAVLDSLS